MWDYKIIDTRMSEWSDVRMDGTEEKKRRFSTLLNTLGSEGWELVTCPNEYVFIFARELK
jgi:hypothetical protein